MSDEKTITQMLAEYNKIGNDLLAEFGDKFRERAGFKDRADALRSLAAIKNLDALRRAKTEEKSSEASDDSPKTEEKEEDTTSSEKEDEEMTTATAKKKPAAKKVKSVTARPPRAGKFADDAKISLLVDANPRREGTGVHKQFELLKKGTVGAYLKAGGKMGSLNKSIKKKWAKVT